MKYLIQFIVLAFLFLFLTPVNSLAANIPYLITEEIPTQINPGNPGGTFFAKEFEINFSSGIVVLSSNSDGTGQTQVNDAIEIVVIRPNGTYNWFNRTYPDFFCFSLNYLNPSQTNTFLPGINKVQVRLQNICGNTVGSSRLYLVNIGAPEPTPIPTPLPTPTPTPTPEPSTSPSPTPEPTPEPTPSPTPIPSRTPLILIPGIGGSELKVAEDTIWSKDDGHGGTFTRAYLKDEKIWVNTGEAAKPGSDDYFDVLRMKPDGLSGEANLDLTGNLFSGAYQQTLDFFEESGYTLNQNLFVFSYDWRKDIAETSALLDQKIQDIKQQTGAQKVDIVSHSMGGLVARNYISNPTNAQNVSKLFTLGGPHLGSVQLLKTLVSGDCLYYELGPFCLSIAPSEVSDVIQNSIGSFELAPSQSYFNFYTGIDTKYPYPYQDETGSLDYQQIKEMLSIRGHNTSLFSPTETFHSLDNELGNINGVDVIVIAGSGQPTLGQIIEKKVTTFLGISWIEKDIVNVNGDKTVPLFSASLNDPARNLSLLGNASVYYTNQNHGDLVSPGPALELVKNKLNDINELPQGASFEAYKLSKGRQLSVHSPVNIHVYDALGNHTGPTEEGFETNIPGSSYDTLGDAKFIYLPEDGQYSVNFEATGEGSFDFKIRKFENDTNTETVVYNDIPLTSETKAETVFDTNGNNPVLQVDENGDGLTDQQIKPTATLTGNSNFDQNAPKTTIQLVGTLGSNGWYRSDVQVSLAAEDEEGGSGINKIEYSLDDGKSIQEYEEPFIVSANGATKIKYRSIDNAGNSEEPKEEEINIDKTAPEVKIYANQNSPGLVVEGIDKDPTIITKEVSLNGYTYTISDSTGNILRVYLTQKIEGGEYEYEFLSLQYNQDPPIRLPENEFKIEYKYKNGSKILAEQEFEIEKKMKIEAMYDQRRNKTTIYSKESGKVAIKVVKDGLILLNLFTKVGLIEARY